MVEHIPGVWGFTAGILLGVLIYMRGLGVAERILKIPPMRAIRGWLYARMYFDELYRYVFVNFVMALSWLAGWFDRFVVDGIVWAISFVPMLSGFALKLTTQRGYLQGYAAVMLLGIAAILMLIFL